MTSRSRSMADIAASADVFTYPSSDGTDGQVLTTDGSGNMTFEDVSTGPFTKVWEYKGTAEVATGTERSYIPRAATLNTADIFASTAPSGSAITVVIKKNGTSLTTITLPADSTSDLDNTINSSFVQGDYLTADITQIGSTTAGSDVVLNLKFS